MALVRMSYSDYQLAIFDAIENGDKNIAINAVAGSGKTTTIVSACKRLRLPERKVKFLAFNKLIADELKTKLNGYAEVSTLHSFGFSILKSVYNTRDVRLFVDDWKWQKYVKDHIGDLSRIITDDTPQAKIYGFCCNVSKLFNLARVNLIEADEKDKLEILCEEHQINTLFDEIDVVDTLLEDAYKMPKNLVIDFTDMIVLPLLHKDFIPTYNFVFIDECQDLNAAQRELMLCAAKGGRFVAVGDRNQAINGFAGADCASFDKIARLPNTMELPLSVNYRCGVNMVKLAQEIVPNIEPHLNAIKGEIKHCNKLSKDLFKPNDMVLCRKTAPLVGLCMNLIANNITAVVKGKDIAQGLKMLIDNADTNNIDELLKYLDNEKNTLLKIIMNERKCDESDARESARFRNLEDKCKCVENICLYSVRDTTHLKGYIDRLFTDENVKNAVMLSTVHKSKGLEANRVIIVMPNDLPLKWRNQKEWQYQQEVNLKYVALTRARKELIFLDAKESELTNPNLTK